MTPAPRASLVGGLVLFLCLLSACMARAVEKDKTLIFMVYTTDAPPYFRQSSEGRYIGVVPFLLERAANSAGYKLIYLADSRRGSEEALYQGRGHGMVMSPEWAHHPNQLTYSVGFLPHRSFFYGLTPPQKGLSLRQKVQGSTVCTREQYVFPLMDQWVREGVFIKLEASDQAKMLNMMQAKRCDYAYLSEYRAQWYLQHQPQANTVYQLAEHLDSVDTKIAFAKSRQHFVDVLNKELEALLKAGKMPALVDAYMGQEAPETVDL